MSSRTKRVKLKNDERHLIYLALGTLIRYSDNMIGNSVTLSGSKPSADTNLRKKIKDAKKLIEKVKNS